MNLARAQLGQAHAITTIVQRCEAGDRQTAIVAPPRTGKSHIIRAASLHMQQRDLISLTLAVTVNDFLADQIVKEEHWNHAIKLFEFVPKGFKYRRLMMAPLGMPGNRETFLSTTIQLIQRNVDVFLSWIDFVFRRTGRRIHLAFDEAHYLSLRNQWWQDALGKFLETDRVYFTYYTGSPYRTDNARIPGFDYDEGIAQPVERQRRRAHVDPSKFWSDHFKGTAKLITLKAHSQTTLEEAWDANVLCHLNHDPVEVVDEVNGHLLSELSGAEEYAALARAVNHPHVIADVVDRLVRDLMRFRTIYPEIQAMVFCGNDDETTDVNHHAKKILRALSARAPALKIIIATSANDQGAKGKDQLKSFAAGGGDVLIVKQMAALGVDFPAVKVGADLSTTRTYPSLMQRLFRPATPYNGLLICTWITPADRTGAALWHDIVAQHGGQKELDLTLIKSIERTKETQTEPEPFLFDPTRTISADFQDSRQNYAFAEEFPGVDRLLSAFPSLAANTTKAEVAVMLRSAGLKLEVSPAADSENTGPTIASLQASINSDVHELAKRRVHEVGYDADDYEFTIKDIWNRLKTDVGMPTRVSLEEIDDIALLRRLQSRIQQWIMR